MTPLVLLAQAQAAAGVTIPTAFLVLAGFLLTALGVLAGGAVAWGRFQATLEQLRADQAELKDAVRKGQADGAQIAVLQQRAADQDAEVKRLRQTVHDLGTSLARLTATVESISSRVGHLDDDLRRSHTPSPR